MKAPVVAAVVVLAGLPAGAACGAGILTGTLTGTTQISFGCPGPVTPGGPSCNPWHPFPHARFSIARRSSTGEPVPNTTVVVRSDAQARFTVRLDRGTYLVTPLPQHNTHGGPRLTARVRASARTTVLVRFEGYPRML